MNDERESDADLILRHDHVKIKVAFHMKRLNAMKLGSRRTRLAMWIGSLNFTLSQIESEMRERKLLN